MANTTIPQLPFAISLDGTEQLEVVQNGVSRRTTTSAVGGLQIPTAGGSNTQVQYNNGGFFAGSSNFTFNGTNVVMGANLTVAGKLLPNVQTITSAATITPNANADTQVSVNALAAPATIAAPTGTPSDGQSLVIRIEDNGTARALTWTTGSSGAYRAVGVVLPTTTVAGKVLYVGCRYNANDLRWDAVSLSQEA